MPEMSSACTHRCSAGCPSGAHSERTPLFSCAIKPFNSSNWGLVAPFVAVEVDLLRCDRLVIVADVEEVSNVIEQRGLALFLRDVFAKDDHPLTAVARRWPVGELGHVFVFQFPMNIATLANNLTLDVDRFRSLVLMIR